MTLHPCRSTSIAALDAFDDNGGIMVYHVLAQTVFESRGSSTPKKSSKFTKKKN